MQIERERFEAWLSVQPDGTEYNYAEIYDCVVCRFIRQTTNVTYVSAGDYYFRLKAGGEKLPIPEWFQSLLWNARRKNLGNWSPGVCPIRIEDLRAVYAEQNPPGRTKEEVIELCERAGV